MEVRATTQGKMIQLIYKDKDAAAAFRQRIVEFTRAEVYKILENEHRLAQQPFVWLEAAVTLLYGEQTEKQRRFAYGDLIAQWESAVQKQLFVAQRDIAATIRDRSAIVMTLPAVKILMVDTDQIKLRSCPLPLCQGEMVDYIPVLPEHFSTTILDRVKRLPPFLQCPHHIPVPLHAQAIITNNHFVYTMKR